MSGKSIDLNLKSVMEITAMIQEILSSDEGLQSEESNAEIAKIKSQVSEALLLLSNNLQI